VSVKLRLKRMGRRHRPYYRLAAVDTRAKRDGRVIEELGYFDPLSTDPDAGLSIDTKRAQYWLGVGARPSETVRTLLRRQGVDVPVGRKKGGAATAANTAAASTTEAAV